MFSVAALSLPVGGGPSSSAAHALNPSFSGNVVRQVLRQLPDLLRKKGLHVVGTFPGTILPLVEQPLPEAMRAAAEAGAGVPSNNDMMRLATESLRAAPAARVAEVLESIPADQWQKLLLCIAFDAAGDLCEIQVS